MSEQKPDAPEQRTWLGRPVNLDCAIGTNVWNADDHRLLPRRLIGASEKKNPEAEAHARVLNKE
jgi:hypothetical protein